MSEKPLSEVDTETVADVKLIDQHSGQSISGSLIGAEQNSEKLIVWVDGGAEGE